jgi:hypothetical protein
MEEGGSKFDFKGIDFRFRPRNETLDPNEFNNRWVMLSARLKYSYNTVKRTYRDLDAVDELAAEQRRTV